MPWLSPLRCIFFGGDASGQKSIKSTESIISYPPPIDSGIMISPSANQLQPIVAQHEPFHAGQLFEPFFLQSPVASHVEAVVSAGEPRFCVSENGNVQIPMHFSPNWHIFWYGMLNFLHDVRNLLLSYDIIKSVDQQSIVSCRSPQSGYV